VNSASKRQLVQAFSPHISSTDLTTPGRAGVPGTLLRCRYNATELCMLRETRALIFATGTLHDRGHLLLRCRCVPGFLAGL